jgi:hypothetical protein
MTQFGTKLRDSRRGFQQAASGAACNSVPNCEEAGDVVNSGSGWWRSGEVEDEGGVVAGAFALALLPVDLGVGDALGERGR